MKKNTCNHPLVYFGYNYNNMSLHWLGRYKHVTNHNTSTILKEFVVGELTYNLHVTGTPDGSLLWQNDISVLNWQLKNQKVSFLKNDGSNTSEVMSACAQLAVYLKCDLERVMKLNMIPDMLCGICTNGTYWVLLKAIPYVKPNGNVEICFQRSQIVCYQVNFYDDDCTVNGIPRNDVEDFKSIVKMVM
jgi:hypothetical protein